ncbi:MAG TPA: hypothetical protein VGJ77_05540 [Gaiellaceae bacterium]
MKNLRHESITQLRRALFGYRAHDVDLLVASHVRQLEQLAGSVDRLWREREALRTELDDVRAQLRREVERRRDAETAATAAAARVVAEAEEQASRIRQAAGRRVADEATRIEELLAVRERLLGELRGVLGAYSDLLHAAEANQVPAAPAAAPSHRAAEPASEARRAVERQLYPRLVELDAGPFTDFAELAAFERSLARLPNVEDVHIRTFGDDRAAIELTLSEETPIVHELRRHLPYRVAVTSRADNRLTLDVEGVAV